MKRLKKFLVMVMCLLCASCTAVFFACDDSDSSSDSTPAGEEEATVSTVSISGSATSVAVGSSITLTAAVTMSNNSTDYDGDITWASSATSVATVSNGVVTGVAAGKTNITATADGVTSSAYEVTVTSAGTATVTAVEISGTASVAVESTITLTAAVTMSDSSTYTGSVTWESSNTSVATVSGGVVTGVAEGKTNITATADGVTSSTFEVTVTAKEAAQTVTYSYDFSSLASTDADYSTISTAINTTNSKIYIGSNTVSSTTTSPVYYVPGYDSSKSTPNRSSISTGSNGTYIQMGGATESGGRYFAIDVSAYKGENISITVEATPKADSSRSLFISSSATSTLTQTYAAHTTGTTTDDAYVDNFFTLTYEGVISESATTLCICGNEGFRFYSIEVTFAGDITGTEDSVTALTIDKTSASMFNDGTLSLTATATGTGTVTWSSSDVDVATVSDGTVTPVAAGTTVISASVGYLTVDCVVTVTAKTLSVAEDYQSGITLAASDLTDGVDLTQYLVTNLATSDLTFALSEGQSSLSVTSGTLSGTATGTSFTVTVTHGTLSATLSITVSSAAAIELEADSVTLAASGSTTVTVDYSNATYSDLTKITVTGSDGNTSSGVTAAISDSGLTITAGTTAGVYKVTVANDAGTISDSVYVVVASSSSGTFTYTADAYYTEVEATDDNGDLTGTGSYSGTDTLSTSNVTITPSSGTVETGTSSKSKKTSDETTASYTYYLQVNASSRSFEINISNAVNATITVYASHTTSDSKETNVYERTVYIGTTAYSTTSGVLESTLISGASSGGTTSYLNVVSAANLSDGTYYVYADNTIHVYAIIVTYTAVNVAAVADGNTSISDLTVEGTDTTTLSGTAGSTTVISLDTSVATASVDDSGAVTVTGVAEGTTYVLVDNNGTLTLHAVTVSAAASD